jgi:hypothetical protein
MIDFYYAPTPNGRKVAIMPAETGLAYRTILMRSTEGDRGVIDLHKDAQFSKTANGDRNTILFNPSASHLKLAERGGPKEDGEDQSCPGSSPSPGPRAHKRHQQGLS